MTEQQVVNLVSWPAAFFVGTYALLTVRRWLRGRERPAHVIAIVALSVALVMGFLLRPLDDLGIVEEPLRSWVALAARTVALIASLGLTLHLILDKWRD